MEASARKKKRPLAAIPENLEELSKPELIKIIQSLQQQVAKKHKGDEVDAKALQAMRKRSGIRSSRPSRRRLIMIGKKRATPK